jgi:ubiquinone/menaquinone biosynthesis C-methylase UbiE
VKGHPLFAATYDFVTQCGEATFLRPLRQQIVGSATGSVLEIGAGTGANLPYYQQPARLVAVEPDPYMLPRARKRARMARRGTPFVQSQAEELPFGDASFDAVISTLVLCTVEDQERSLTEIRRVLKPSGTLRFIEHVRYDDFRGRVQDRVLPVWRYVAAGCHPNRRTVEAIEAAGFAIVDLQRHETPLMPFVVGVASADGE